MFIQRKCSIAVFAAALWLARHPRLLTLQRVPILRVSTSVTLFGRHLVADPIVLIDGRAVDAQVSCEEGGSFPECEEEKLRVELAVLPEPGDRNLQIATPGGLISNEVLLIVRP